VDLTSTEAGIGGGRIVGVRSGVLLFLGPRWSVIGRDFMEVLDWLSVGNAWI